MTAMNKNLINIQNYHGVNNYQSFDSTLNKNKLPSSEELGVLNQHLNQSQMHPANINRMFDNSISKF